MKMTKSKTLWFSAAVLLLGILDVVFQNLSYVQNLIDEKYYGIVLIIIGVVSAILRFYTTQPLDDK
jgi:uncharacterized membrane-anchored protein